MACATRARRPARCGGGQPAAPEPAIPTETPRLDAQIPEERTKDGQYVQKGSKPALYLSTHQVRRCPRRPAPLRRRPAPPVAAPAWPPPSAPPPPPLPSAGCNRPVSARPAPRRCRPSAWSASASTSCASRPRASPRRRWSRTWRWARSRALRWTSSSPWSRTCTCRCCRCAAAPGAGWAAACGGLWQPSWLAGLGWLLTAARHLARKLVPQEQSGWGKAPEAHTKEFLSGAHKFSGVGTGSNQCSAALPGPQCACWRHLHGQCCTMHNVPVREPRPCPARARRRC